MGETYCKGGWFTLYTLHTSAVLRFHLSGVKPDLAWVLSILVYLVEIAVSGVFTCRYRTFTNLDFSDNI